MALVISNLDPRACHHVLKLSPTELTIGGHGLDREQNVAVGLIGVSIGDKSLRQRNHVLDVLCRHRLNRRRERIERRHVLSILLREFLADCSNIRAAL